MKQKKITKIIKNLPKKQIFVCMFLSFLLLEIVFSISFEYVLATFISLAFLLIKIFGMEVNTGDETFFA